MLLTFLALLRFWYSSENRKLSAVWVLFQILNVCKLSQLLAYGEFYVWYCYGVNQNQSVFGSTRYESGKHLNMFYVYKNSATCLRRKPSLQIKNKRLVFITLLLFLEKQSEYFNISAVIVRLAISCCMTTSLGALLHRKFPPKKRKKSNWM